MFGGHRANLPDGGTRPWSHPNGRAQMQPASGRFTRGWSSPRRAPGPAAGLRRDLVASPHGLAVAGHTRAVRPVGDGIHPVPALEDRRGLGSRPQEFAGQGGCGRATPCRPGKPGAAEDGQACSLPAWGRKPVPLLRRGRGRARDQRSRGRMPTLSRCVIAPASFVRFMFMAMWNPPAGVAQPHPSAAWQAPTEIERKLYEAKARGDWVGYFDVLADCDLFLSMPRGRPTGLTRFHRCPIGARSSAGGAKSS